MCRQRCTGCHPRRFLCAAFFIYIGLVSQCSSFAVGTKNLSSPLTRTNNESKFSTDLKRSACTPSLTTAGYGLSNLCMSLRRNILKTVGVGVIAIPIAGEVYSRGFFPPFRRNKYDIPLDEPKGGWDSVTDATIVFHGAGGQDTNTDVLMSALNNEVGTSKSYETIVDWSEWSQNILKASFVGQTIGKEIAAQLLSKAKNIETVHVIGISVGSFAANSCIDKVKQERQKSSGDVYSQLTLLDPFCQRGVLDLTYGDRNFGKNADYPQQYLNTDDPVPFTNKSLSKCACIDVTALRPTEIFGHDWPLIYYSKSKKLGLVSASDKLSIGKVYFAEK